MSRALDDEQDRLAAEHALRVLDGAELSEARQLMLSSPEFAQAVGEWEHSLAAIAGEAPEHAPPARLWERIEQSVRQSTEDGSDQTVVLDLRRRLRVWRGVSFAAMAVAAALVLFVSVPQRSEQRPADERDQSILLASLSSEETGTSLSAAYDPARQSLLVTPGVLAGAPGHQHQLWVIPPGGDPVPVGLLAASQPQRLSVRSDIAPHFSGRSTLAVSVEPIGGSPTGQPTGPVIAAGEFSSI